MVISEDSLDEISDEYIAKRAKGLQHLVLRYASLDPEMTLDAPQTGEYDIDELDQSPENINTFEEKIDYEADGSFEAPIDEYPKNVQEITRTLGWFEDSFDSITLFRTLQTLSDTIAQEAGNLLALETTGYLQDLDSEKNEYSARREVFRAFEWIENLDKEEYLDPNLERYSLDSRDSENILSKNEDLRDRHKWEFQVLTKDIENRAEFVTEEVDMILELDSERLVVLSGEYDGTEIEGEMNLEKENTESIEIEGSYTVPRDAKMRSNQEIIPEEKRSVVASPSWNFERFLEGNNRDED